MHIEELMRRDLHTTRPEQTLEEAARLMWEGDCGCLPVCDAPSGDLIGMITDRDICMHAMFTGRALPELEVEAAMSQQLVSCHLGESLAEAERRMRDARIRRLPVVDDQRRLVGVISLADLAEEAARELDRDPKEVTAAEIGDTLSKICEPRGLAAA